MPIFRSWTHFTPTFAMSSPFKIIIIGGGLGGLTFAVACQRYGIQFDLYEQASKFGTVGAGVEIGPNAVQVLNKLGLEKEFEDLSSPFSPKYMVHLSNGNVKPTKVYRFGDIIELERRLRLQLMIFHLRDECIALACLKCFSHRCRQKDCILASN